MQIAAYVLLSIVLKVWYEKEREKIIPLLLARNVEFGEGVRINIRGKH